MKTYLAFAIDRLADWNNSLCHWEKNAEVSQQLFGRQAIPMTWDFAEANPLAESTGSIKATIATLSAALESLPAVEEPATVSQLDARAAVRRPGKRIVATDPPYYDYVGYADLSDFFYVWLRRNLTDVWPSETATLTTPKADELVADPRFGSRTDANHHFESGMHAFFEAIVSSESVDAPATIFYAFKATEASTGSSGTGWEAFLQALIDSGMTVTATWPIRTENRSRLRNLNSNALAASVVLACRTRAVSAAMATRGQFVAVLRDSLDSSVRLLQKENIAPVDLAQSAVGPGIAVFSSFAKVVEADGSSMTVRTALSLINDVLSEVLNGEESEFDADTRFALTWFDQFGHNPGPFGDADLLARAKDTSVAGVANAGIIMSRDGSVRPVDRTELPADWDPVADKRLTVWETTQHLINALESSESDAAELLVRLGEGLGERARQLAYLLYQMCDRKRWADEAIAYNMLVTAWPELQKLAHVRADAPATQLF